MGTLPRIFRRSLAHAWLVFATTPIIAPAAPTVSLTSAVVSDYVFRGRRLGGASFQPSIDVAAGAFAGGLWSNFPIRDKVRGQSDPELDLYGSATFAFGNSLHVSPGFTLYTFPNAPKSEGYFRTRIEPSIALSYVLGGVKITPVVYYDITEKGTTVELGASYALPLTKLGTELDLTATAGTRYLRDSLNSTAPSVKRWGDYLLLGAAVPFQLTAKSKVSLGFTYAGSLGSYQKTGSQPKRPDPLATKRGIVTLTYGYTF